MKICTNCNVTYGDSDYMCWNCFDYLVPAKECPSCGKWQNADFDICEECHLDWVRKYMRLFKAFRESITDAQFENFDKWSDGEGPETLYLKLKRLLPKEVNGNG